MAEFFADGHLRFLDGEWRDDNGDPVKIKQVTKSEWGFSKRGYSFCKRCGRETGVSYEYDFCPHCGAEME